MAKVISGKYKGASVDMYLWSNKWVATSGGIFDLTSLEFTEEEFDLIMAHNSLDLLLEEFEPREEAWGFVRTGHA